MGEELAWLQEALKPTEVEIFRRCLEGEGTPEIASVLGCSRWTVRRVLDRIGLLLRERLDSDRNS